MKPCNRLGANVTCIAMLMTSSGRATFSLPAGELLLLQGNKIGAGIQKFSWRREAEYGREIVQ
jgi:hypothetical protein